MHNEWYTFKSIISLLTNYNWYNRSWSKYNYALNWSYWYLPMACASPALSFSLKFFWRKEFTTVLSSSSFSSVQVNNFQKVYFSPFFRPCAILERFWVAYQRDPKIRDGGNYFIFILFYFKKQWVNSFILLGNSFIFTAGWNWV